MSDERGKNSEIVLTQLFLGIRLNKSSKQVKLCQKSIDFTKAQMSYQSFKAEEFIQRPQAVPIKIGFQLCSGELSKLQNITIYS